MKIEIVDDIKEKISIDNKYIKDAIAGKIKINQKRAEKTIIITPETFAKIFSPERIKLMLKLKRESAQNIYQLAKGLNRKYEAVYRDIKLLEGFGIIKINEKDKKMIPVMDGPLTIPELIAS